MTVVLDCSNYPLDHAYCSPVYEGHIEGNDLVGGKRRRRRNNPFLLGEGSVANVASCLREEGEGVIPILQWTVDLYPKITTKNNYFYQRQSLF